MNDDIKTAEKKRSPVAEYIKAQVALCGKPQMQIAEEAGFGKPNNITMIKDGITKLPLLRVSKLAKALGVDPIHLFRMTMQEYQPENWAEIQGMTGNVVSGNEMEIIKMIRQVTYDSDPKVVTDEQKLMLSNFARSIYIAPPEAKKKKGSDAAD